jgi:hemin uptake protein HemP
MRYRLNKYPLMQDNPRNDVRKPAPEDRRSDAIPTLQAASLFQGKRELWIVHEGERYRLRLTRRNKLILQK